MSATTASRGHRAILRSWPLMSGAPPRIRQLAFFLTIALAFPFGARGEITYLNSWGSSGTGDGQFSVPADVSVGPTGTVYVCDLLNERVEYFDRSGNFLGTFGSQGSGNGQFSNPNGVDVSSTGVVYVADGFHNARIEVFTSNGSFVSEFGTFGSENGQFNNPNDVQLAPNGNLYVVDGLNYRIQELTTSGDFVTAWGSNGSALGQFGASYRLAVGTDGKVFVADPGNGRVQVFDGAGNFQTAWSAAPFLFGMAVNSQNQVYVVDSQGGQVTKYDSAGNALATFGSLGTGPGQLEIPTGISVAPSGEVYVADAGVNRVHRFFDSNAWVSGANTFSNAAVGAGQLLGVSQTLSVGKTLNVSGTTTVNAGATLALAGGTLNSTGLTLSGVGAALQINSGTLNVTNFSVGGGATYHVATGQTLSVGGSTTSAAGGTLAVDGALISPGGVFVSGVLTGNGQIGGTLTNNNGGEVRVGAAQHLYFSTGSHNNAGSIQAIGGPTGLAEVEFASQLVNAAGTGLIVAQGGANLRFDGGLANNGSLATAFGQMNVFGDVTNNAGGIISVSSGASALFLDDVVQNSTLSIAPGSSAVFLGLFSGSGGFTGGGTAWLQGDLRPGNSPALVTLGGNAVFGAGNHYHLQLGGASIGSQYDSINITGAATLGGSLDVELTGGFQPTLGEKFTALAFGSRSGDFASYSGLAVGHHLTLQHAYVGNSLVLTARPTVDGDINTDGIVSLTDLSSVASNWLHVGIAGDANGDGIVNLTDLTFIASNWHHTESGGGGAGSSLAIVNPVPEPSTIVLGGLGLLLSGACSRCARRRPIS